ncbi:MAG TPA: hypothetical protein VHZ03_22810 [Trebonia sp.]|nr:hypothetical protein [Trebonia sp.]
MLPVPGLGHFDGGQPCGTLPRLAASWTNWPTRRQVRIRSSSVAKAAGLTRMSVAPASR